MWACLSLLTDLSPRCLMFIMHEYMVAINTTIYWFILIQITWLHVLTKTWFPSGQ